MNHNKELGIKGEKAVSRYLRRRFYKILERNYSLKCGEIDIIAQNREYIVFVEVKTRREGGMLPPASAVDFKKQRNIKRTASAYLNYHNTDKIPRYDIAEVIQTSDGKLHINYIDNAF